QVQCKVEESRGGFPVGSSVGPATAGKAQQVFRHGFGQTSRRPCCRLRFNRLPKFVCLNQPVGGSTGHYCLMIVGLLKNSVGSEFGQRLGDGGTAHLELLGEHCRLEPCPFFQLPS